MALPPRSRSQDLGDKVSVCVNKFGTGDYVGGPYGCAKFGANPSMGASGQMGEIQRIFLFIYTYFS